MVLLPWHRFYLTKWREKILNWHQPLHQLNALDSSNSSYSYKHMQILHMTSSNNSVIKSSLSPSNCMPCAPLNWDPHLRFGTYQTLLFGFDSTSSALALKRKSPPPRDPNKIMCPRSCLPYCLYSALTSSCGFSGMLCPSSRTYE